MYAYSPTGSPIVATAEMVPSNAAVWPDSFTRNAGGQLQFDHTGESDVFWDSSETRESLTGELIFVDQDGKLWPESQLQLRETAKDNA